MTRRPAHSERSRHQRNREQKRTWTVGEVIRWTTDRFADVSSSARLDAEVLLADCLRVERIRLYMDFDKPLSADELARYRTAVRRRLAHEPAAYIVGRREFWSMSLEVTPSVLVPRPETELLVEHALDWLRREHGRREPRVVDVGTGSGAIAVALGCEMARLQLVATDVDQDALVVARRNIQAHDVYIELVCGDLLEPFTADPIFDVVLSNPPYIPTADLEGLSADVGDWEPRRALDGGPDGLTVIRKLIAQAAQRLRCGGLLMLEIDSRQGRQLVEMLTQQGFCEEQVIPDLAGLDRVVAAVRE